MDDLAKMLNGKIEERRLNNHIVQVIAPKEHISYDEMVKRVDKILAKARKDRKK
jgi:hypothetical protein